MALFGRDYDRDYGTWSGGQNRGERGFSNRWGFGGDRGDNFRGNEYRGQVAGGYDGGYYSSGMNNRGFGGGFNSGHDAGYTGGYNNTGYNNAGFRGGYDTGYRTGGMGYDDNYKSRWQTDYGDPFGDRTSHTPFRMMRGEYHGGGYDRNYMGGGYDRNYMGGRHDTDNRDYYGTNPMGYDPYGRGGWDRNQNEIRQGRGYDRGWF